MAKRNLFVDRVKLKVALLLCISVMLISTFGNVFTSSAATAIPAVTIDFNNERQEIDGFGASNAWVTGVVRHSLPSTEAQKEILDSLFSTTDGAGLSMVRNRIPFDLLSESGNWDWNHWDISDTTWLFDKVKADYSVTNFFSTPWTPAPFMKTGNGGTFGEIGGKLSTDKYQAYADYLADYVKGFKDNKGIDISAVSIQNEPDWKPEYESCEWTAEEIRTFVKNNLKPTFAQKDMEAKVIIPEGLAFSEELAVPTLNDADSRDRVDIIGVHQYAVDNQDPNLGAKWLTNTKNYNKKLWVTEVSTDDPNDKTINDGLYWVKMLHKDMTVAEVNAFCYWWLWNTTKDSENPIGDKGALITLHTDDNGNVISYDLNKRLYTLGQYSRFIRPGYKRVGSDTVPAAGVYTTAYKDPSNGKLIIVAINDNTDDSPFSFNINGSAISSYTAYRTSDSENIADLGNTVVNGSSFDVLLKGKSITTFCANAGYVPPTVENPFTITSNGELVRIGGIQATVDVAPAQGAADHTGQEVVLFQLMRGNRPVSIVALERNITSQEEFTAYFNVDPNDTSYKVRAYVLDALTSELNTAPVALAEWVTLQ